jgi:hypothetical protein
MATVKTMSSGSGKAAARSTSGNAAHRPGKRTVAHRKLHLEPGHSALTEKIGENTGRKTERAATTTQYRLSRVKEFKAGTGAK